MKNFKQTKLALAVGTALMVMAGGAQAAALVPLTGATKSVLVTTNASATAAQLYATAGTVNSVKISLITVGAIGNGGATSFNTGTIANDDVTVQYGATIIPAAQLAVAFNTAGIGNNNNITVTIAPAGTARVRLNNATGALEYTADGTVAAPTWAAVTISAQVVTGNALTEATVAIDAGTAATGAFASSDFILPATVKTFAAAAADKISGLTVDFKHPVAAPTKTTLPMSSVAVAPLANGVDISNATTTGISVVTYTATTGSTTSYDVVLTTPGAVDWNNDAAITAADAALYVPLSFNTGVTTGATGTNKATPLVLTVAGTGPAYSNIFVKTTGVADEVAAGVPDTGTITDGASPVIVTGGITFSAPTAVAVPLTNLSVTFSEPLAFLTGNNASPENVREVLENISVVGTGTSNGTLAAVSLNSGATPTLAALAQTAANQGTLTINNLLASDVATLAAGVYTGKSISVGRGITYQEPNDANYTTNLAAVPATTLDDDSGTGAYAEELMGGVRSATGVVEAVPATPVAQAAVVPAATVAWGADTSALASASSALNPDQIDTITVTFGVGKGVKLAAIGTVFGTAAALTAAKTAADLAANLVVDVRGTNGLVFQVHPTAVSGTAASATGGTTLTVTLPTALIYSKLAAGGAHLKAVYIGYVADGNNSQNNVLVATDAATSPIRVAAGTTITTGSAANENDLAGAEPVVLPLVFTATATGGQSTLLTQSIQTNLAGAAAGDIVIAYPAYWVDLPKVQAAVVAADIKSGKITNTGDKVATDLAIELVGVNGTADSGAALAAVLQTELRKVAAAIVKKDGISDAAAAVAAKDIPVYVKLIRSSDTQANTKGAQNYLEARAFLATTHAGARLAGANGQALASGGGGAVADEHPVYEVLLNPNTGKITGRLTGDIAFKAGSATTTTRGLIFVDGNGVDGVATAIGSALVAKPSATGLALPGTANLNLLVGLDPRSADFGAFQAKNPFLLLVHRDATGKYTLLTSADPAAANYVPFSPDIFNKVTGTGGVAMRAETKLSVTDVKALAIPASANWALYGLGKPAMATKPAVTVTADKAFPRKFVGLNTSSGLPVSFWTNDGAGASSDDIALALAGNKVGLATELMTDTGATTGPTLSNITDTSYVKNAVALGWMDENGATDGGAGVVGKLYVAQATGVFAPATALTAPKLDTGWSLVTVPGTVGAAVTSLGTVVDAVIKVGAQVGATAGAGTGQFTWLLSDGAMPSLTAGEAVIVHAKAAGSL